MCLQSYSIALWKKSIPVTQFFKGSLQNLKKFRFKESIREMLLGNSIAFGVLLF